MIVALDMDGVLAAHPTLFQALYRQWVHADWFPVLLAGYVAPPPWPDMQRLRNEREQQVRLLLPGIVPCIEVCVGVDPEQVARTKGNYCRFYNVGLFIDDSDLCCAAVKTASPATVVLRLL